MRNDLDVSHKAASKLEKAAASLSRAERRFWKEVRSITEKAEAMRGRKVRNKISGKEGRVIGTWPDKRHAISVVMDDGGGSWLANPFEFDLVEEKP